MKPKTFRCAVYTRKSTEADLEQEFNSLQAQTESCKAYILSQAGEGWSALDRSYSDGGISGGHMDRPGLKQLIHDIEDGLIDIVVVYKVDRLTRSLSDFAKLVDVFDAHNVSFVSVTQAFNTTNSMGRLTLNVLLSFAQFEREVTAERIRDKVAASKKRGKWMGGLPPIGYDNIDKKLVINESEAEQVRYIFKAYLELGTVSDLTQHLSDKGFKTKARITKKQNQTGGRPFSRGHIYQLLSNPVYIGKIRHKDKIYDGEHDPIIALELWEKTQSRLKDNAPQRRRKNNLKSNSLLAGILYDETGDRLTPIYTKKASNKRYRYYVSLRLMKDPAQTNALRLPAGDLERLILSKIQKAITSLKSRCTAKEQIDQLEEVLRESKTVFENDNYDDKRNWILKHVKRVTISRGQIELSLIEAAFAFLEDNNTLCFNYPISLKRRGVETKFVIGDLSTSVPDPELIQLIAKAHKWWDDIVTGKAISQKSIAEQESLHKADVSRTLRLAFLSPHIVRDIIRGNHPVDITASSLTKKASHLPVSWDLQKPYLGYTS